MGGVYLGEEKNGGSILELRKKWGEYTWGKKKMGGVHICGRRPRRYEHPPLRVFLAPSLNIKKRSPVKLGTSRVIFYGATQGI